MQKHLLRGSQFDRSTLRPEFEQLHEAWPWSRLACRSVRRHRSIEHAIGPTVDVTDARNARIVRQSWRVNENARVHRPARITRAGSASEAGIGPMLG